MGWKGQPRLREGVAFTGLNPEGMSFHRGDGAGEYFVLSEDGSGAVEGEDCKSLEYPDKKRFRGATVKL